MVVELVIMGMLGVDLMKNYRECVGVMGDGDGVVVGWLILVILDGWWKKMGWIDRRV